MICFPDLSTRAFALTVERTMQIPAKMLFKAWTEQFDLWFASPGSVMMKGEVDTAFYFETSFAGKRHPH